MTDLQFGIAVGIPAILFSLNFIAVLWQARGLSSQLGGVEKRLDARIDALQQVMNAKFETAHQSLLRVEQVMAARLKHLEER